MKFTFKDKFTDFKRPKMLVPEKKIKMPWKEESKAAKQLQSRSRRYKTEQSFTKTEQRRSL